MAARRAALICRDSGVLELPMGFMNNRYLGVSEFSWVRLP